MSVKDNLMVAGGFQGELICKWRTEGHDSDNHACVRVMDAANFCCLNRFTFPWSVNNATVSPDGKMLAVLGDSTKCLVADAQTGKVIGNLKGHLDYSFSSATCRLWDVRNISESMDAQWKNGCNQGHKIHILGRG